MVCNEFEIGDTYRCLCTIVLWSDKHCCVPMGTLGANHMVTIVDSDTIRSVFRVVSDMAGTGWVNSTYLERIE